MKRHLVFFVLVVEPLLRYAHYRDQLRRGRVAPWWMKMWADFLYDVFSGYGPGEVAHWDGLGFKPPAERRSRWAAPTTPREEEG